MAKIIVFGSMNMDFSISCSRMPEAGETIEGSHFFTNPGGKGANQAVAASLLGASTYMIACVGEDIFGKQLVQALQRYGVNTEKVCTIENTNTGVASIVKCDSDNRIILDAGANHVLTGIQAGTLLESIAVKGDIIITQNECEEQATYEVIRRAKAMGLYTIHNCAPAKEIPDSLYPLIDLLVVNQSECEFLTGLYPESEAQLTKAASFLLEKGIGNCIITLGKSGSAYLENGSLQLIPSQKITVVDTTAAGDTYIGALAAALLKGTPLASGIRFATKAAALTVSREGAQQSIPTLFEVEESFKEDPHE